MKKEDVNIKTLARLARLNVTDEEVAQFENEIPEILSFVDSIKKAGEGSNNKISKHRNIMREDKDPHESGIHTDDLLDAAPKTEGKRIKVKQVIKRES
jgi:aspartyl-tRNA(Asn)/glutamyl-tRNA(Gln) amidotransferase subunit C